MSDSAFVCLVGVITLGVVACVWAVAWSIDREGRRSHEWLLREQEHKERWEIAAEEDET